MWAHPQQAAYPAEHFAILVSTTNTNTSSFTLLGEWTLSSGDWKQFSVDLSAYAGQTGYIAVRHYNCSDQFYINVDDFVLDADAAISIEYPVTITAESVYVRLKDNLNPNTYTGTLTGAAGTLNGSISLSGEVIAEFDITLAANPVEGGTVRGAGAYAAGTSVTARAAANKGYSFVNWTENDVEVSTDANYTFTVSANRTLVANFELATMEQVVELVEGYNWFVPTVDMTLAELEAALGENGILIKGQDGKFARYDDEEEEWSGSLHVLEPGHMYRIQVADNCSFTLSGETVSSVSYSIENGTNWIGFTGAQSMTINQAMVNFEPVDGDRIKAHDGKFSIYDEEEEEWSGSLRNLVPGDGYIYISQDENTKVLTFPNNR